MGHQQPLGLNVQQLTKRPTVFGNGLRVIAAIKIHIKLSIIALTVAAMTHATESRHLW